MRKSILVAAASVAILGGVATAQAQTFPSRPITMIVPLAIGGSTDVIARIVAEGMRASLGQPVVVDNVAATFAGNQNDRVSVRSFVNLWRQIAHGPSKPAVLLLDHPSLSGLTKEAG